MRRALIGLFSVALFTALPGCGDDPTNVILASFSRPNKVAFVCVEVTTDAGVAQRDVIPLTGTKCADFAEGDTDHLHALITQSSSGELAAVDMDEVEVLDNNPAVPGFTFLTVSEKPTGIVVRPDAPEYTYVSSFGARTVQAIETASILDGSKTTTLGDPSLSLAAGPVDLAVSTEGTHLYAAIKENGTIEEIVISADGSMLTNGNTFSLSDALPAQVASVPEEEYARYCPMTEPVPVSTVPRAPVFGGAAPAPNRMRVDPIDNVLLVADASLPLVHRFQLGAGGATPLGSINVGVPVLDLTVTPPVPATLGETDATKRYLYAIDATDGTVLVVDYDETSPTFGAVLPVFSSDARDNSSTSFTDRIRFGSASALTLEAIWPEYDAATIADDLCEESNAERFSEVSPDQLRGVFVAVALSNGQLQYLDVFDLDAECRGGTSCANPAVSTDIEVRIRRHRPRAGSFETTTTNLVGSPSLSFDNSPGQLGENGEPTSGDGPGLDAFVNPLAMTMQCPTGMVPVFGESDEPYICASVDPWSVQTERWSATWEDELDGASGGLGRLVDSGGTWSLEASDGAFCNRGVLGTDDVVASALVDGVDPEAGYVGDQLVITADVPPTRDNNTDEFCRHFVLNADISEPLPIAFEIVQASQNELVLGEVISNLPPLDNIDPSDVADCFGDFLTYEVRVRDAYVVESNVTGSLHRVIDDGGAGCRVNTAATVDVSDPLTFANARAIPGRPFINPSVAFTIQAFNESVMLDALTNARFVFDINDPFNSLRLSTGSIGSANRPSLTSALVFFPNTDELMIVDLLIGLGRIDLQNNAYTQYFR